MPEFTSGDSYCLLQRGLLNTVSVFACGFKTYYSWLYSKSYAPPLAGYAPKLAEYAPKLAGSKSYASKLLIELASSKSYASKLLIE